MVRKIAKQWHYKDAETEHKELKQKHPHLNISRSATRISDGEVFEIGQWVEIDGINDDNTRCLIGFDQYDYPLPIEMCQKIAEYTSGNFHQANYKQQYKRVIRGICHYAGQYSFNDLEGYDWLKVKKNAEEEPSQNIAVNNVETNIYQPHATYDYASGLEQ